LARPEIHRFTKQEATMQTQRSTPTKIKAKLGFHGVSDMETLKSLTTAYEGLFDNPAYPKPPVDLSVYKTAIDGFSALIIEAADGSKRAISAKDKQRVEAIRMYAQLGHYVEVACGDDRATFNSSGFSAATKTRTAPTPLSEAKFSFIDRGPNSGQVVVKPQNQSGAIVFEVRYALLESNGASPAPWTMLTLPTPKPFTISGLTMAGIYQFQIRALGKLGYTDWMDSKTFVCA
jgi:hypothetical protein